jgi:hypothetical protein
MTLNNGDIFNISSKEDIKNIAKRIAAEQRGIKRNWKIYSEREKLSNNYKDDRRQYKDTSI